MRSRKSSWNDPGSVTPRLPSEANLSLHSVPRSRPSLPFCVSSFFFFAHPRPGQHAGRNFNLAVLFPRQCVSEREIKGRGSTSPPPSRSPYGAATFIAPMKHRRGLLCNGPPNPPSVFFLHLSNIAENKNPRTAVS